MPGYREAPHDSNMERSTLGAALQSEKWFSAITSVLPTAQPFYEPLHRDIYQAMLDLQVERMPVDPVTVSSKLKDHTAFMNEGGILFLNRLVDDMRLPASAEVYAREVFNKSILRSVMDVADEIKSLCVAGDAKPENVLSVSTRKLFDLNVGNKLGSLEAITPILRRTINLMEAQSKDDDASKRVKTGFPKLDRALGGLGNGTLNILAARPGMGKSSLALNIAHNAGLFYKKTIAIFSLEMSKEEIAKRFLSARGQVDSQKFLYVKELDGTDWGKLGTAAAVFLNSNIYIDDSAGLSPVEMIARCRQLQMEHRLDLVIIDYLQLMSMKGRRENRQQEISEISRTLKLLAKDLDVAVLALSQLSREAEKHEDTPRPKLSDLRESGSIEQDADSVMMLYRDLTKKEDDSGASDKVELIIAKNRSGPTKTISLGWIPEFTLFIEPAKIDEPEYIAPAGGDAAMFNEPPLHPSEDLSYLDTQADQYQDMPFF